MEIKYVDFREFVTKMKWVKMHNLSIASFVCCVNCSFSLGLFIPTSQIMKIAFLFPLGLGLVKMFLGRV